MLKPLFRAVVYRLTYQLLFFVVSLFLAATAGVDLFGIISLMIVNAAAFIILTDLGTGASIIWHRAGEDIHSEKIFSFAAGSGIIQLLLFFLLEFTVLKITGRTLLTQQPQNSFYLTNELIYFIGLILTEKYSSLFYGHNRAKLANKTLSIITGFFLGIFIFIYITGVTTIGPFPLFCSMIFVTGLCLASVFHLLIQRIVFVKTISSELRSLLVFSGIAFVANIIQFFAYRLDFWMVKYFYNTETLGVYAQANRFAQLIWIMPVIIAGLLTPAIRSKTNPLSDDHFRQLIRTLNLITIILVAGVVLMAIFFYYWFFPAKYSDGVPAFLLMLPGYFFFATTTLIAAWLSAKKLLWVNLIGSCICFVVILIADLVLIPSYSLKGAALANTIAYSITTFYFILQFQKYSKSQMKDLFAWKKTDILFLKKFVFK